MTDTIIVHNVSLNLLRKWSIFANMDEEDLRDIKCFHSFETPSYLGCRGGWGILLITVHDEVFGMGHNCSFINILGFHRADLHHRVESVPELSTITTLSQKKINQISIGGLIGAALSDSGTLYWWGNCYNNQDNGDIMTPHSPRTGRRRYLRVSCGHRLMVALTLSGSVYVWGQVVHNTTIFLEGERIKVGSTITQISCGLHHLAMLDVDGHVYTWGRGDEGQRGLAEYGFTDQYTLTRVSEEPCFVVRCGPYSTFCLTVYCELMACGSNLHLYLGFRRHPVTTLTSIRMDWATTDLFVVGLSDHTAIMTAGTSVGDFYTWGEAHTPYPRLAEAGSFMEVFTSWHLTPELTFVRCVQRPNWSLPSRTEESNLICDILMYIYLRSHPDSVHGSSKFLCRAKSHDLDYLANEITSGESGSAFVLQKFLQDLGQKQQLLPNDYNYFEGDVRCTCPYHPFGGCSFYE